MLRVQSHLSDETETLIHRVIGCAITVHTALGAGYPEKPYARAIGLELNARGIPFEREKAIRVIYRDQLVGMYRLDLVVANTVIVEIKAVEAFASVHRSQLLGYLRATGLRVGLLMNFRVGAMADGVRRVVL